MHHLLQTVSGARAVIIDPPARHPAEIDAKRPATPERRSGFTDA